MKPKTEKNPRGAGRSESNVKRHGVKLWLSDEEEIKVKEFVKEIKKP